MNIRTLPAMLSVALTMVACVDHSDEQPTPTPQPEAISFDAYQSRATAGHTPAATRAGNTGTMTLEGTGTGEAALTAGFGVFAFYSDGEFYTQHVEPQFMYNQHVTGADDGGTTVWSYTPVKYWPEETGDDAVSDDVDRLTFFAYAPHVDVEPTTGQLVDAYTGDARRYGITALSSHSHRGDPLVHYAATLTPATAVDLCYAVASPATRDLTKPAISTHVPLHFEHALTQLAIAIDADVDAVAHGDAPALGTTTRIYVRRVTLEGFATDGILNLNSTAATGPRWLATDGIGDLADRTLTIHDGRRNGSEGRAAALQESVTGLNPAIIQSGPYTATASPLALASTTPGVTATACNLLDAATTGACIMVIPNGQPLRLTVAYDVETYDPNLRYQYLADGQTTGSSVENVISATVRTTGGDELILQPGKSYQVGLHLGMTSVKFDASAVDWKTGTDATGCLDTPDEPAATVVNGK